MSCEGYIRKRSDYEVGFGKQAKPQEPPLQFRDDHELLAYLKELEHVAEQCESVSYESLTSD